MPRIQRSDLPRALFAHLLDRIKTRNISADSTLLRQLEPHVKAAQDHEDQTRGDRIHRERPNRGENPVSAVVAVVHPDPGERVEQTHDSPRVQVSPLYDGPLLFEVGFDLEDMAGTSHTEIQAAIVISCRGPLDFAIELELTHEIIRLREIAPRRRRGNRRGRSEEHTSELQSPCNLVCRLLLEKKKKKQQRLYLPVT